MAFDKFYIDWNYKRIKAIINYYGHNAFLDKTILDLGCGHSDIGGALSRLGARVIAVDARQNHLQIAKKKYPNITTICVDLDQNWPFNNQKFDFVLNLGVICHLTNYKQILQKACNLTDRMVLESEICDSNNPDKVIIVDEHKSIYDWAFNGIGYKPSAPHIEKLLQESGMRFKRFDNKELNTGPLIYNWVVSNTDTRKIGHRRLWFVERESSPKIINTLKQKNEIIQPEKFNPLPLTIQSTKSVYNKERLKPKIKNGGFKVAVCISGYLRCFEKTFSKLYENLLKHVDADIFIHTWDHLGSPLRGFDIPLSRISTHAVLQKINKLYKPERIVIEPIIKFPTIPLMHSKNHEHRDINGVLSMFYKLKACNQIKKEYEKQNQFKYDCVVRLRSDLMFLSPLPIYLNMDINKLYVPKGNDFWGVNDQLAFGSSEIMDIYSNVFDHIQIMLHEGESFNPEKLLRTHIHKFGLPLERCSLNYYIKR